MQSKQAEAKTYSYHFSKIIPSSPHPNTVTAHEPFSPLSTPKNFNINFRYHTEGQQPERKGLHFKKQCPKMQPLAERCSEPLKKYTFSLLANEVRQQRALENKQIITNQIQTNSRQALIETAADRPKNDENKEKSVIKKPVKTNPCGLQERNLTEELAREIEVKRSVERQLAEQKYRNEELEKKLKQLQSLIQSKNSQIAELIVTVGNLQRSKQQNALENSKDSKTTKLQFCSGTYSYQWEDSEHSFQKQNKEWSTSTIIYNYEEEYKQVLSIFQLEINEENFHDRLLSQIEKLFKKVEEFNKSLPIWKEKEKEHVRMVHHLRKIQAENVHFIHMTAILTKQHQKVHELLQEANIEISRLNLSLLNLKYGQVAQE